MNNVFFCSDHHFGHKKIIEYENKNRPFSCLEEMHEVIIQNHNSVVKQKDTVYFVGDFAFGLRNVQFAERLNGEKRLVMGNHDTYPSQEYLKYFKKLYGVLFYQDCVVSHIPVHPHELGQRWFLNIHGHLHSKKVCEGSETGLTWENRNYYNVSLEQNNLFPTPWDSIKQRIEEIMKCDTE